MAIGGDAYFHINGRFYLKKNVTSV